MKAQYKNTIVAESENIQLVEGNSYFPSDSVKMEYLKESDTQYTCPWKGETQYYDIVLEGETIKDGAWGYPEPKEAAKHITGHVAFDESKEILVGE